MHYAIAPIQRDNHGIPRDIYVADAGPDEVEIIEAAQLVWGSAIDLNEDTVYAFMDPSELPGFDAPGGVTELRIYRSDD